MAKTYSVFARAYAGVIKKGRRKIEDVRPDELRQDVIEILASEGLGADGKPLPKEEPVEDKKEEVKNEPKEDIKEEETEPEKPVEDKKEDKLIKDTKDEDKSPVEKDKGAK